MHNDGGDVMNRHKRDLKHSRDRVSTNTYVARKNRTCPGIRRAGRRWFDPWRDPAPLPASCTSLQKNALPGEWRESFRCFGCTTEHDAQGQKCRQRALLRQWNSTRIVDSGQMAFSAGCSRSLKPRSWRITRHRLRKRKWSPGAHVANAWRPSCQAAAGLLVTLRWILRKKKTRPLTCTIPHAGSVNGLFAGGNALVCARPEKKQSFCVNVASRSHGAHFLKPTVLRYPGKPSTVP